jgi:hypothetical protein
MRYMLIMRATDAAIEASKEMPLEEMLNAMGAYNEALMQAGVMIGGEGLSDATDEANFVVDFDQDPAVVTDGPYGETHELFNGFWMLEVSSKEEAIEWARRCPLGPGSKLEVRRVHDDAEFEALAPDNEYVQKEAGWREELSQRQARTS